MARKVTKAAFAEWVKDAANLELVLDLIAGGKTLQKASVEVKQPYTCLHEHFHSTPENLALYDKARKAWADAVMDEALRIADGVEPDKEAVAKAKLQVETRFNQAKAYNRPRWGDKVQVEKDVSVTVDAGLLGFAADLLLPRPVRVIEGEPGRVEAVTPAALPAPAVK